MREVGQIKCANSKAAPSLAQAEATGLPEIGLPSEIEESGP
jgi:hypothetical protein